MAKKWNEVLTNPAYKKLSYEQQEAARNEYFDNVVKPNVPDEDLEKVRVEFDDFSKPTFVSRAIDAVKDGIDYLGNEQVAELKQRKFKDSVMRGMDGMPATSSTFEPIDTSEILPVTAKNNQQAAIEARNANTIAPEMGGTPVRQDYYNAAAQAQAALPDDLQARNIAAQGLTSDIARTSQGTVEDPLAPAIRQAMEANDVAIKSRDDYDSENYDALRGRAYSEQLDSANKAEQDSQDQAFKNSLPVGDAHAEFRKDHPYTSGVISGTAGLAQGGLDFVPLAADAVNQVINPYIQLFGGEALGQAPRVLGAKELQSIAANFKPEMADKKWADLKGAGEVTDWLTTQAAIQSPQLVGSFAATLIPKIRVLYLAAMGATSAGGKYQQNKEAGVESGASIADSFINGSVEILTEMLPFGVFDKLKKFLPGLSKSAQVTLLGNVLNKSGIVATALTSNVAIGAVEEILANTLQNTSSKYVAGDKSIKDITQGNTEAGIIGGLMGSPIAGASIYSGLKKPRDDEELAAELAAEQARQSALNAWSDNGLTANNRLTEKLKTLPEKNLNNLRRTAETVNPADVALIDEEIERRANQGTLARAAEISQQVDPLAPREAINAADLLGGENVSNLQDDVLANMAANAIESPVDNLQGSLGNLPNQPRGIAGGINNTTETPAPSGRSNQLTGDAGAAVNPLDRPFASATDDFLPKMRGMTTDEGIKAQIDAELALRASIATNNVADVQVSPMAAEISRAKDVVLNTGRVLQNRDRSSNNSIAQMQAIAANPDFLRAGISNDMATGAPVVFANEDVIPSNAILGDADVTVDGKGNRYDTQYAVIEAGSLIASNNVDGTSNAEYQNGNADKLRTVAGNGRTAGIQRGYEQGTAGQYNTDLIDKVKRVGIDAASISGIKNPVLVRIMKQAQITDDIGDLSNITQTAQLSPVEQAKTDATRAGFDLANIDFNDDGNVTSESVKRWVQSLPQTEQSGLTSNGQVSMQAVTRFNSAMFNKAYGDDSLVQLYAEATDQEVKNIINAVGAAAPLYAQLAGTGDYDIRGAIVEATQIAVNAKRKGEKLNDYLKTVGIGQSDEAVMVAQMFADNVRSQSKIVESLRNLAQSAIEAYEIVAQNNTQGGFFAPAIARTRAELFRDNFGAIKQTNEGSANDNTNQTNTANERNQQPTRPTNERVDDRQTAITPSRDNRAENGAQRVETAANTEIKAIVETIVKRRAAANELGKIKAFDNYLAEAKKLLAGEQASVTKFRLAAASFNADPLLANAFTQLANITSPQAKAVADAFKAQTGDHIETAGLKLAGISMRNLMRDNGNLDGEKEANPYTPEQVALIDQHRNFGKKSPNLFHTTKADNLASIAKSGLITNAPRRYEGVSGEGKISLSANEELANVYGSKDDVMLRVNKDYKFDDLEADNLAGGQGAYTTAKNIAPEHIEYKQGKKWLPLSHFKIEAAQAEASNIDAYKQRIADAKTIAELQAIAGEIQRDSALSDAQAVKLDDALFEAQDALDKLTINDDEVDNQTRARYELEKERANKVRASVASLKESGASESTLKALSDEADNIDKNAEKILSQPKTEKSPEAAASADLLGENTQSKQAIADAERAKDAKRNTGSGDTEGFTLTGSIGEADQAEAAGAQDLVAQKDEVTRAKEALDAAGITGAEKLNIIAQVRDGKITADEVVEAHKIEDANVERTVADIHTLADNLGIPWDNDAAFMQFTQDTVGKRHLDDLTATERNTLYDKLSARKPVTPKVDNAPIEDFGQKIGGAKKDTYTRKLEESKNIDVSAEPLSKSWPEPDYQALLDNGADTWTVAYARASREVIPTKPSKGYKLANWVKQVNMLRDVTYGLMDGSISITQAKSLMSTASNNSSGMSGIVDRIELYQLVGHEQSLKGVSIRFGEYSVRDGIEYSPSLKLWTVEKQVDATARGNWPRELATGKTKQEAMQSFKEAYANLTIQDAQKAKETTFDIYTYPKNAGKTGWFIGKKLGRNYIDLENFATVKEAREYKRDHHAELVAKLEKIKEIPNVRPDSNKPRVGEDMRNGQDVTPELFAETFSFKGVQFGNYVEGSKRQQDLNESFDALMDMAAILDIPPKAISLNGELGLAFGARGTGGIDPAKAHYEAGYIVINLTKKDGAGSLGHEWWHALDNYFSRMRNKPSDFMTAPMMDVNLSSVGAKYIHEGEVRKEMVDAFGEVVKVIRSTALKARSSKLDAKRSSEYWTTGLEMSARSFETYLIAKLQDNNASNDYLANIVSEKTWSAAEKLGFELDASYPYPTAAEIPAIRAAFDNFFSVIETKETEAGVALFSRRIHGDNMTVNDYVVPETPEFDGNMDGALAYTPVEAVAKGIEQLPIKLTIGVARGSHRGYGISHINDNNRSVPKYTDDLAENYAQHVATLAKTFDVIYSEGDRLILKSTKLKQALVVQKQYDKEIDGEYYSVVTLLPAKDNVWGVPDWVGQVSQPTNRQLQSRAASLPRDNKSQQPRRESLRKSSKLNINDLKTTSQEKSAGGTTVSYKKRRTYNMREVSFSRNNQSTFYSALTRAVTDIKIGKAPAVMWKGMINNLAQKGIKPDEIEWTGVNDWLALQTGAVTKEQVLDYLNSNGVQVEEVVLADEGYSLDADGSRIDDGAGGFVARGKPTKYSQHTVPGGDNYKELLLTLPSSKIRYEVKKVETGFVVMDVVKNIQQGGITSLITAEDRASEFNKNPSNAYKNPYYRSPHFDQVNLLAHVRFDERIDADGSKVLFIQEIQSDWAQSGKKIGFKRGDEFDLAINPPIAPFVTKTDAWVSLALKRMMRYAAENGFDKVAIINGEQAADLYDLSKQVDSISYIKDSASTYKVWTVKNGVNGFIKDKLTSEQVEQFVGKDIAKKIIDKGIRSTVKTLDGLDLKIGGEGMRTFYDSIVPKVAKDVLKKLGGVVDTVLLPSKESKGELTESVYGMEQAYSDLPPESKARIDAMHKKNVRQQVGFTITPAMRETIMRGLPLFSKRRYDEAYARVPDTVRSDPYYDKPSAKMRDVDTARTLRNQVAALEQEIIKDAGGNKAQTYIALDDQGNINVISPLGDDSITRIIKFAKDNDLGIFVRNSAGDKVNTNLIENFGFKDELGMGFYTGQLSRNAITATYNPKGLPLFSTGKGYNSNNFDINETNREKTNQLEKAIRQGGYRFTITPLSLPDDITSRGNTDFAAAEKIAGIFGKKIVWVRADGEFSINGVINSSDAGSIFIDVRTDIPAHIVMGHELSHHMEKDSPKLYADLFNTLSSIIINNQQYRIDNSLPDDMSDKGVTKEIIGDLLGDNMGDPAFWDMVGKENPSLLRKIADVVTKWLNKMLLRATLKGYGSEQFVTDARAAKQALAKAVAKYAAESSNGRSVMGNAAAVFSRSNPSNNSLGLTRTNAFRSTPDTKMDKIIRVLQDKNIDLKRVQKQITQNTGNIADRFNAYLQEELFHGRSAKRTQDFIKKELDPLITDMRMRKVELADFEEYLWMRHAPERNAKMAEINEGNPDGLAGVSTEEAQQYMNDLAPEQRRSYEALAERLDAMTAKTLDTLVSYALESQATVNNWKADYQYYVPLMREDMDIGQGNGTGQGYKVKGSSVKQATGSRRNVVDILANVAQARERAIIRGEKNRVATALIGLVKTSPNDDFWKAETPPTKTTINKATGFVETYTDPNYKSREDVIVARIADRQGNIQERSVTFNKHDERAMAIARSLLNLDVDQMDVFLTTAAVGTRWISSVNTQYNPIFGLWNLWRDAQAVVLNLGSTPLAGKQAEVMAVARRDMVEIFKDIRSNRRGTETNSEIGRLFEEFQKEGAQTGYRDMFKNANERSKAIEHALDPTWWTKSVVGKVLTLNGFATVPMQYAIDAKYGAKGLFNLLSDYNTTLENVMRLAVYKVALDNGHSKQQAASLAKNISVNFNRKGAIGRQAGALYAFFNSSVQGTARMGETLFKDGKLSSMGKKVVYGGLLLGSVQALILAMAGFGEDEPADFIKNRNIVIPIGDGKYVTWALPLGFNAIPAMGRLATEFALSGGKDGTKKLSHAIEALLDMFNPIGNAGMSLQTLAPSVIDPAIALVENRNWNGLPIYKEDFNSLDPSPGYSRAKDTATTLSKGLAYGLNALTGGDEDLPGAFSPTPDQIDYLIGQVTGGVGRELSKTEQTIASVITGEELPTYKIPLFGRLYGETKGSTAQGSKFYENVMKMNKHDRKIDALIERGEDVDVYIAEHPEAELAQYTKQVYSHINKLRKMRKQLKTENANMADLKEIDNEITGLMQEINDEIKSIKEAD